MQDGLEKDKEIILLIFNLYFLSCKSLKNKKTQLLNE